MATDTISINNCEFEVDFNYTSGEKETGSGEEWEIIKVTCDGDECTEVMREHYDKIVDMLSDHMKEDKKIRLKNR